MDRYARQRTFPGWDRNTQAELRGATVLIAGTGGLGSPVSMYLASAGIGNLQLVDNGTVHASNLNRQFLYTEKDLDNLKVDRAASRLSEANPTVTIKAHAMDVVSDDFKELASTADVIIDCLDSFESRQHLNIICHDLKLPLVHGAVEEMRGQVTTIIPGETACLTCFLPGEGGAASPPIIGAAAGVIGSIQALEALKLLTNTGELLKNRLLFWDGAGQHWNVMNLKQNPGCRVCSSQ